VGAGTEPADKTDEGAGFDDDGPSTATRRWLISRQHEAWSRRLKLLQMLLHRGRLTTRRVSTILEVDRRRGLEDIQALESHGVPVSPVGEGRDREWVLAESWRQLGMNFALLDRLSLLLGRNVIESFLHATDIADAFARLDHQVEALTTEGESVDLTRRFVYVRELEKDYSHQRALLRDLIGAIIEQRRVSFIYKHARPPQREVAFPHVAPYTLAVYKRGLYIIIERRGETSLHAVERIRDLEVHEGQRFDYPIASDYDPHRLFEGRFGLAQDGSDPGEVRLRFTRDATPYATARLWMPGQRVETREDGGCDIVFTATGLELLSRVLEYGEMVEVIAPAALRERVRDTLRGALARYGDG